MASTQDGPPRRSSRERRPPQRFADYDYEPPPAEHATDLHEAGSVCSLGSRTSRGSQLSTRSAALRLQRLKEEHELQRQGAAAATQAATQAAAAAEAQAEAARALELHRATTELELSQLEEEERDQEWQDCSFNPARAEPDRLSLRRLRPPSPEPQNEPASGDGKPAAPAAHLSGALKDVPNVAATLRPPPRCDVPAGFRGPEPRSDLRPACGAPAPVLFLDSTSARAAPATHGVNSPGPTPVHVTVSQPPKPPKLDILAFDGSPERYPFFAMQVKEAREGGSFTDLRIAQHLRDRLKGQAFEAVHGTLLAGGSLTRILETLEARFGNRFAITQAVTDKLVNRPRIRNGDVRELNIFCTEVFNATSVLEAIGFQAELDNYRTISNLVEKLPAESQLSWGGFACAKVQAGQELTCQLFHEFLSGHLKERRFATPRESSWRPEKPPRHQSHATAGLPEGSEPTATTRQTATQATKQTEKTSVCYYCKESHWIAKCRKFLELTLSARREWVTDAPACERCLSTSHRAPACRRQWPCGKDGCTEEHHVLLHDDASGPATVGVTAAGADEFTVLMKTVVVELSGPAGRRRCSAYLDEGSSVTLISQDLSDQLGLRGRPRSFTMKTLSGITRHESSQVDVSVTNVTTGDEFTIRNAYTLPSLSLGRESLSARRIRRQHADVEKLPLIDEIPQILIGIDHADLIATQATRPTTSNGPLLQKTQLGWALTGRVGGHVDNTDLNRQVHRIALEDDAAHLDELARTAWETEWFGCKHQLESSRSREDRLAEEILDNEVFHNGERWVAPLLRRNREERFPPSRNMAEKRALAFERRIDKSQRSQRGDGHSLSDLTQERLEKMLADGHFRQLTPQEAVREPENTWYLPLMAVTNPNKPNRVRLVLDAAATSQGMSLNDTLMQGPDLMNSIPGILCRWREKRIAVMSDVVAMFSQILVDPRDRPSLRFLWRGRRRDGPFDIYESPVVIFGASCSPSVAGYCYRRTAAEFAADRPLVTRAVMEDTYVDDVITGTSDEREAVQLISDLTETLRCGGFELGPWTSNSPLVLQQLPAEQRGPGDVALGKPADTRALGVTWRPSLDVLTYRAHVPPAVATKRSVLSTAMAVFDPVGFLSGWLLRAKLVLQELWRRDLTWDEEISAEPATEWANWIEELQHVHQIQLPRHLFDEEAGVCSVELHAFCDASDKGFAAVLYYRWRSADGRPRVSFVSSRARAAPLKKLSIPRLELQAAVLAARMIAALKREARVKIESTTCWSDSKNVLAWIQSTTRRFHVFVSNRAAEIHDVTRPEDWRYVPTYLNPADAASRGQALPDLQPDGQWAHGPDFLWKEENEWPSAQPSHEDHDSILVDDPETKTVMATGAAVLTAEPEDALPDLYRISRWLVAVRTAATVRRWLTRHRDGAAGDFKAEELQEAETVWIKVAQREHYPSELRDLQAGLTVNPKSKIANLCPILVDGIICIDSRIKRSPDLSPTARLPPILPRDHRYVKLLIQHLHERMGHRAHEAVLVELRQRCWVPQARRAIRSAVRSCQFCIIRKARPQTAQMAPLPTSRVTMMQGAFCVTGVDYFGPMLSTRGRSTVKLWGVLFRCMATKAVHLELTDSLDTEAALMAISRLQARRGNVRELWSDNGTNLRAADRELKRTLQALDQQEILSKLAVDHIKWYFSPPADPEAGGVWERNIRTVKETLRVILKEQKPRYEVLLTLFCEVEKIMNATPLFHVPVDPEDDDVLTPYHFLIGRATPSYPAGVTPAAVSLRKRWQFAQQLADHFWRRWVREYLPTLATRPKWRGKSDDMATGDVVIVADERHPRGLWPRGIVERVYRGADGHVRSAEVRTPHGRLHRPVRKLLNLKVVSRSSREAGV